MNIITMKTETLNSPLEGTVCNIKVKAHEHVHAGQTLLGIRDNQMLHLITASAEADVDELLVKEGQFVEPGEPLVAMHEETAPVREVLDGDPEDVTTWRLV